jgi:hypothetical protein
MQHYSLDLSHPNLVIQCFGIPWTTSNTQHYQNYHGNLLTTFVRHEAKATQHVEGCEATHHSFPCDPHGPGHAVLQVDYIPLSPGMSPWNINVPRPHMAAEMVKKDLGQMKPPKPQQCNSFRQEPGKSLQRGSIGWCVKWDTCLNNNEDSFIWTTLNHWTTQMCLM